MSHSFRIGVALSALALLLATRLVTAQESPDPATVRWDFEESFEGVPGVTHSQKDPLRGWMRDNWGNNITQYSRDTEDPHSGDASLRIRCLWWNSGMAAALSNRFRLLKEKNYVLRLWLRAEDLPSTRSVAVTVRTAATQGSDLVPLPGQLPRPKWDTHATRRCSAGAEWAEFTLDIKPNYDCDAEIQLGFEAVGTVWLDDVSITEGSIGKLWLPAPPSDDPPRKGNLLYNGSFEVGPTGWGRLKMEPLEAMYGGRHIDSRPVETDAPHGRFALRVDATEWFESDFLRVRPGQEITLSAWMKAEKDPVSVSIYFLDGTQIKYTEHPQYSTSCKLTTEWQRFSVSGRLPATANNAIVVRIWGGQGPFLIDAVQVEEGELSPFALPGKVEVGVTKLGTVTGIYRPGETSRLRIHASGKPDTGVRVTSSLEDYYGETRKTLETSVKLDDKGAGWTDVEVDLPEPGIYRVVSDAKGATRPGETILAQVKRASAPYGGIHATVTRLSLDFTKDMGFGWWRLHDNANPFSWSTAEPESGKFFFNDNAVDRRLSTGVKLLATLYHAPEWARKRAEENPGEVTVTADYDGTFLLEDWKNYVRTMVRHFKDRIHHWEIWNEPSGLAPAEYFKLLKNGCEVIKEEDPGAFIVGGGGLHDYAAPYVETLFDMGGLDYMDAYSFHGYMLDGRDPWEFGRGLTELMRKHGKVVPFWDTEWGQQCNSFKRVSFFGGQNTYRWPTYPWRTAVNLTVRHELAERALGVEANFWYTLGPYHPIRDESGGLITPIEYDGSPRATVIALANTWDLLGEAELVEKLDPSEIIRVYTFKRPGGALLAVDTKLVEGLSARVTFPIDRAAQRVNVMGGHTTVRPEGGALVLPLNDEPLLLLFNDADPGEIAKAARGAKFVNFPPAPLMKLLSIDITNRSPELLHGARYTKEIPLGFDLGGWRFDKKGETLLVFAGLGPANASTSVPVNDAHVTVYDSLGNIVPVENGRVTITNRAPYVATGDQPEKQIGSPKTAESPNLLRNPSFEEGEIGKTPADWSEWNRFTGESTFMRDEGGRTPESSGMAVLIQSPKDEFVYASQGGDIVLRGGGQYGFSVWLKASRPVRADVYLEIRGADGKGLTDNRARYDITTEWSRYASAVTIPKGKGTPNGTFRAIVQLFETPNTRLDIDDAELRFLGPAD